MAFEPCMVHYKGRLIPCRHYSHSLGKIVPDISLLPLTIGLGFLLWFVLTFVGVAVFGLWGLPIAWVVTGIVSFWIPYILVYLESKPAPIYRDH